MITYADSAYPYRCLEPAALGRMCNLLKRQSKTTLTDLEEVYVSRLPALDPNPRVLVMMCGRLPNVWIAQCGRILYKQDYARQCQRPPLRLSYQISLPVIANICVGKSLTFQEFWISFSLRTQNDQNASYCSIGPLYVQCLVLSRSSRTMCLSHGTAVLSLSRLQILLRQQAIDHGRQQGHITISVDGD
jgi:hypothetical protein